MKFVGGFLVVLALVIGLVPQFTDCHSQGKVITMPNGNTMEMKCFYTAMASIATAIPLGGLGAMLAFSTRKETRRMLAGLGGMLGAAVILIPTALIGVCPNTMMLCNMVLKPTLILSGTLVALTSLIVLFTQMRPEEPSYDLRPAGA